MEEEGKYFISMIATSVEVFLEMTYEYIIYFKKNKRFRFMYRANEIHKISNMGLSI